MQGLIEIEFYAEPQHQQNLYGKFQNHFGIDICKCREGFALICYHQRGEADVVVFFFFLVMMPY